MNILESEEIESTQAKKCKLAYLSAENKWMESEYLFLCELIQHYKEAIKEGNS